MFALEKRGYVKAGPWTPEASVEHPEAGIFLELAIHCSSVNLPLVLYIQLHL